MTGLLTQYLGAGLIADRPVTPDIHPMGLALYRAEDEMLTYRWNHTDGVWELAESSLTDAPIDGIFYGRKDNEWVPGVEEAPEDGTPYIRQDAGWIPGSGGGSLPLGGTDGQVLTKLSSTDGDADWETPSGGGGGGVVNGARIQVTANHAQPPAGVNLFDANHSVVFDTIAAWDATTFRFVIPAGVAYARIDAGIHWSNIADYRLLLFFRYAGGVGSPIDVALTGVVNQDYMTGSTGLIPVIPGDTYEVQGYSNGNTNVVAGATSFASIQLY